MRGTSSRTRIVISSAVTLHVHAWLSRVETLISGGGEQPSVRETEGNDCRVAHSLDPRILLRQTHISQVCIAQHIFSLTDISFALPAANIKNITLRRSTSKLVLRRQIPVIRCAALARSSHISAQPQLVRHQAALKGRDPHKQRVSGQKHIIHIRLACRDVANFSPNRSPSTLPPRTKMMPIDVFPPTYCEERSREYEEKRKLKEQALKQAQAQAQSAQHAPQPSHLNSAAQAWPQRPALSRPNSSGFLGNLFQGLRQPIAAQPLSGAATPQSKDTSDAAKEHAELMREADIVSCKFRLSIHLHLADL